MPEAVSRNFWHRLSFQVVVASSERECPYVADTNTTRRFGATSFRSRKLILASDFLLNHEQASAYRLVRSSVSRRFHKHRHVAVYVVSDGCARRVL